MGLLRFIMDWKTKIGMWWFDYVHFPFPPEDEPEIIN